MLAWRGQAAEQRTRRNPARGRHRQRRVHVSVRACARRGAAGAGGPRCRTRSRSGRHRRDVGVCALVPVLRQARPAPCRRPCLSDHGGGIGGQSCHRPSGCPGGRRNPRRDPLGVLCLRRTGKEEPARDVHGAQHLLQLAHRCLARAPHRGRRHLQPDVRHGTVGDARGAATALPRLGPGASWRRDRARASHGGLACRTQARPQLQPHLAHHPCPHGNGAHL